MLQISRSPRAIKSCYHHFYKNVNPPSASALLSLYPKQSWSSKTRAAPAPIQSIRSARYTTMSSNSANKKFTRDHLFDCKGRVALVTGKS
ncbi:hypothetical protein F5B17DRAFT_350738 [Nemania serpens]|nr:hypothetical protein F5B17DRAFT_350738 [Nemania serpens]